MGYQQRIEGEDRSFSRKSCGDNLFFRDCQGIFFVIQNRVSYYRCTLCIEPLENRVARKTSTIDPQKILFHDYAPAHSSAMKLMEQVFNMFGIHPLKCPDFASISQYEKIADAILLKFSMCKSTNNSRTLIQIFPLCKITFIQINIKLRGYCEIGHFSIF